MRREKSLRIGVHHADGVVWGPVCRTHLSEDAVERVQVRHERLAEVLRELREYVQRGLLQRLLALRDAREQEREELGPLSVVVDAGGELAHGVAHLMMR